jgi:hypothetical protein
MAQYDEIARKTEQNCFGPLLERYRSALDCLSRWGIRVPPRGRLREYERRLLGVGLDPEIPIAEEVGLSLLFDLREIDEVTEIVESFDSTPSGCEASRLTTMVRGAEHPDSEEAQSAARDAQYELYLRSIFHRAGLDAQMEEPDLVVHFRGRQFAIAAKRPKTLGRLDDRLRSAVHQLERQPPPRIIAISGDQMLRPARHFLSVPAPELMTEVPSREIERFLDAYRPRIEQRLQGRGIGAVLYTLRLPTQVWPSGQASLATGLHIDPRRSEDPRGHAVGMLRLAIGESLRTKR